MNILVINWQDIKNPFGGGAEVHCHEIFKRIVERGHKVTLLVCKFDNSSEEEIIDGIKVIRVGTRNLFNFVVPKYYKKLSAAEKFDIVIDDVNKIPFYTPLFVKEPLLGISHHFFGKSIYKETNVIYATYLFVAEWIMKFFYKKTPFVVVSESTMNEFRTKGFDTSNYAIVQNAISQDAFKFELTEKHQVPTVTYFGRLKKYKSVDHLLRAFAIVKNKFPESKLNILGRGDFRPALEKLAKKLKIESNITFFGFVDEKTKISELSNSYCVVNTSIKEGWGITNIEANACGTLVISADSPGLRDSVKDGVSGLLYKYGNIEELADKIIKILSDAEYREKLSLGAINWAKSFDWDISADKMLEKCEDVIKNFKK